MTLIVETGSIVANANSYVSVNDAQAFLSARGVSIEHNDNKCESLLLRSMDVLNALNYCGTRSASTQALPFPRSGVSLSDSRPLADNAIPPELIAAQVWCAYYIWMGSDPAAAVDIGIKREDVEGMMTEYTTDSRATAVTVSSMPNVKNALKYLICSNAGRIDRA